MEKNSIVSDLPFVFLYGHSIFKILDSVNDIAIIFLDEIKRISIFMFMGE